MAPDSPHIAALLRAYQSEESHAARGPRFVEVAEALESLLHAPGLEDATLVHCFGPPDLWARQNGSGLFVYFFDHLQAGADRDEWYFHLERHKVTSSGYNRRGINVVSGLRTRAEWEP